jgi:NADPH-dependent ferric siderophore reductase
MNSPLREIRRVRHEIKQRQAAVAQVAAVTPKMLRITLRGAQLAGFTSLGFDDHVKLFFPREPTAPAEERPPMRDYTPRYDAGPATAWALRARDGDPLMVRGAVSSVIFLSNFFEPG